MIRRIAPTSKMLVLSVIIWLAGLSVTGCRRRTDTRSDNNRKPDTVSRAGAVDNQTKPGASSGGNATHSKTVLFSGFASGNATEAETARVTFPMRIAESGGVTYITVPDKNGKNQYEAKEGLAELTFSVPRDGDYIIWFRRWWDGICADHFYISLDDADSPGPRRAWRRFDALPNNYRQWTWSRIKHAVPLTSGKHVLSITNGNDGWRLDKIIVTSDESYTPAD